MVNSPLEQFEIIPFIRIQNSFMDLSINNSRLILFVVWIRLLILYKRTLSTSKFVPNPWQFSLESFYETGYALVTEAAGQKGKAFFPLILTIFVFLLSVNRIGLIPYRFTATSHGIVTLTIALGIWVGKLFVGVRNHKTRLVTIFLPGGVPFLMVPFLVGIEVLGFVIVAVRLPVRLFANIIAGHILLKVLAGFAWTIITASGFLYLRHFLPLMVLFILIGLETGVALIQGYVFTVLTSLYVGDIVNKAH